MPLRLSRSLLLLGVFLLACGGSKSNDGANPDTTPTVESPATPITTPGAASSGSTGAPGATPSGTPAGVSLTPRAGVSTDIAVAKRLESEGDFEGASESYVAIAAKPGATKGEATLGAARTLLELERPADVRILLEPFVGSATGKDAASHYLLARSYAALGMWQQSADQYDAYVQSGRPALPYAYLDRARDLVELNLMTSAIQSLNTGVALGVPASSRRTFLLTLAQVYERAGNFAEAIKAYNALMAASASAGDDALALSRIVAIKRATHDATYTDELDTLLSEYPSTDLALTALENAIDEDETVDPFVRGLIYYRHNDYTKAQPAFEAQIDAAPEAKSSAESYYYVAAILESKSDYETAKEDYAKTVALNPNSPLADDALWWQARLLEDDGDLDEAGVLFERIVDDYPASSWAADAAFHRGMLAYHDGDYRDAASIWAASVATAPEDEEQRLTFWQGKALLDAGDKAGAKAILEPLTTVNEDDYYGVRARALLAGDTEQPESTRESKIDLAQSFDWKAAETWLSQKTGRPVSDAVWSTDTRWARAQELWLVGRVSQGDAEVFDLIEANGADPIAMYTLSRALQQEGRISMSGRAAQRLLRSLDTNPSQGLPKALLSLAYPPAFGSFAQRYAQTEKISPLLLLAFVRQESFFDPRAESPAGALGLTQLVPATGRSIASTLGAGDVDTERLLGADLNLRLGARYMADQLETFDGEIFVALAAYNAGPNAAKRWRQTAGEDADLFLETIEFTESRLYVELVSENYAIYRYLYANEPVPNLPH